MTYFLCFAIINLAKKIDRAVGRSENPGEPVLFGRHNLPPLVEIGLTDLPTSGGASTPRDDTPTAYTNSFLSWLERGGKL